MLHKKKIAAKKPQRVPPSFHTASWNHMSYSAWYTEQYRDKQGMSEVGPVEPVSIESPGNYTNGVSLSDAVDTPTHYDDVEMFDLDIADLVLDTDLPVYGAAAGEPSSTTVVPSGASSEHQEVFALSDFATGTSNDELVDTIVPDSVATEVGVDQKISDSPIGSSVRASVKLSVNVYSSKKDKDEVGHPSTITDAVSVQSSYTLPSRLVVPPPPKSSPRKLTSVRSSEDVLRLLDLGETDFPGAPVTPPRKIGFNNPSNYSKILDAVNTNILMSAEKAPAYSPVVRKIVRRKAPARVPKAAATVVVNKKYSGYSSGCERTGAGTDTGSPAPYDIIDYVIGSSSLETDAAFCVTNPSEWVGNSADNAGQKGGSNGKVSATMLHDENHSTNQFNSKGFSGTGTGAALL